MENPQEGGDSPAYAIGIEKKDVIIIAVIFAASLSAAIYFAILQGGRPFASPGNIPAYYGISSNDTEAGLTVSSFVALLSLVFFVFRVRAYFHTGMFEFYDNRIVWRRRGQVRELSYGDLKKADFADRFYRMEASQGNVPEDIPRRSGAYMSFSIDGQKYSLRTEKNPEAANYVENRVPEDNYVEV